MLLSRSSSFIFVGWNSTREWMPHATVLGRPQWKKSLVYLCSTQKNKNLEVAEFQRYTQSTQIIIRPPGLAKVRDGKRGTATRGTATGGLPKREWGQGKQTEGENGKRVVGPGFMLRSLPTAEELSPLLYTSDFEWTVKAFFILLCFFFLFQSC